MATGSFPLPQQRAFELIIALIEAMRPKQWVKNGFVLAPVLFARKITHVDRLQMAMIAFFVFCLAASSVYLLNDAMDAEKDRRHPDKCHRPIASGRLDKQFALIVASVMFASSLAVAYALSPWFAAALAIYLVNNLLYSLRLKNVVVLDVMMVAMGFILRVLGGSWAIRVVPSDWILLCTLLLSLFLAFCKRRAEIIKLGAESNEHRKVLSGYSIAMLDQANAVLLGATIVSYAIYTTNPATIERFGSDHLVYTVPFVIYGLLRYLYLIHMKQLGGNPTDALLADRPLQASLLAWLACCGTVIYVFR